MARSYIGPLDNRETQAVTTLRVYHGRPVTNPSSVCLHCHWFRHHNTNTMQFTLAKMQSSLSKQGQHCTKLNLLTSGLSIHRTTVKHYPPRNVCIKTTAYLEYGLS
ncbi:hypothetical protein NP493_1606g00055 [Ridgeia piscesae]|uniref:Uncharacterized protein n=1 Tax=Ridgeia piscesae TaxID=27915 RepID=A0AAD9NA50_RIDPI|nr:hypothetical protein NP493_1606g00055 [Ridgeia piscesae]